jgi:sialidase-1
MYKLIGILFFLAVLISPSYACNRKHDRPVVMITASRPQVPVLKLKDDNTILKMKLQSDGGAVQAIKINMNGTTDLNDVESVRLFYGDTEEALREDPKQYGKSSSAAREIVFADELVPAKVPVFFRLSIRLKDTANILHFIDASCEWIKINKKQFAPEVKETGGALRMGIALRQHGDDQVHTYRIPGLTTTNNGTLLAVYDARRESSRDLQGNIDIGLSRSSDAGDTWEPMRIVLDKGKWGGLPEKFNGISDPCILVDKTSNNVFVAALWMHGILNADGQWIDGLNESDDDWNHQWRERGSQPGFDVKQTSQFMVTKSTDDGQTWSEPINLTTMCKKEAWWLWAPAPGHGITLDDGTLVFPTQGRDEKGHSFSNITWSKNGGETWTTSAAASTGTTENMIVQLSDGSVMLNARDSKNKGNMSDTNGRVISVTPDLGKNWTEHSTSGNALIEPACMASLHKHEYTESGKKKSILLFSNPNSRTTREHMTIKVSFDDGKTWPEKYWMLLDEGKGRGYSCLTSIDEQTIGILYEGSGADLVFQKIALSELVGE